MTGRDDDSETAAGHHPAASLAHLPDSSAEKARLRRSTIKLRGKQSYIAYRNVTKPTYILYFDIIYKLYRSDFSGVCESEPFNQ